MRRWYDNSVSFFKDVLRRQFPGVNIVDGLPERLPRWSDSCSVRPGYIGCVGSRGVECALFFRNLEPALAFVQAGRDSIDVAGVDLLRAVDVRKYDPAKRVDVRTIYIGPYLTEFRGCKPLLSRWVDGVRPKSAHWQSPDGRTLSEDELQRIQEEWDATLDGQDAARAS
jgi:hypothetical protein